ncbi:glycosyltransferase family 2 protein [Anabaena cylindrica FACHB-243]|uniref:Glycosyl transferase family 2 n=1 Tax=Anabaena cylindrica (strain ATCC 27899 / PCC 7122) TaxID=272123 RepID=K9ZPK4_ANACC|nr:MULTISPECIES: glycosyltransferase family A protein [Anabaena]AFZ60487.1 glycosyl transferase family 2 [Anabaena cylindrica PCC 7122]MBD2418987.1 glycosyltransferase family 2 protein [Anabaena cylindrica FACHB-243]MBY5282642.1 glycosyltransferase family 2 protein [Anabaena sp. CCAP 1446/1C]MBY5309822.1 glycosyltransferase family 2 protein [Anabaena sp. CCAP 1446/1C]MCM2407246.1 glycosyltransferase family 2 protein [Anabaena sp. CCAP 1446/1C]
MSPINFDIQPEVSIILCTYNRAKYLNQCIDSVIHQTFPNWELLVVDDGSNDHTFELVNLYLQKTQNIRYLKHKNRKLAYAKNVGIQASFSPYITFLDSDDTYAPNHIESRLNYLKSHSEIDLLQGGFFSKEEILVADYYEAGKTINLKKCVLGPTFFGKRKVFFELGGFDNIAYGEDTDFWERAEKIFKTQTITKPETYIYTRAETSITKSVLEKISSSD